MNKRGEFYLAIVFVDGDRAQSVHMLADPLRGDPNFGVTSVNLDIKKLVGEPTGSR
jgi:hypothetical protein